MSAGYFTPEQDAEQFGSTLLKYRVEVGADLLKVRVSGHQRRGGGIRGKVTRFSLQARKRMLELLARVRQSFIEAFFLTLTYPGKAYAHDPQVWKRDLDVFLRRLQREFPQVCGLWRLEVKPRQSGECVGQPAPHYHLLVWNIALHPLLFREWVKRAWWEVVGSGDPDHLQAGTQCDRVRSRRHAAFYVSKYAAKMGDVPVDPETGALIDVGRWWGRFGDLSLALSVVVELPRDSVIALRRLVVRWLRSQRKSYARRLSRLECDVGWSAFGLGDSSHEGWLDVFDSTAFRMVLGGA